MKFFWKEFQKEDMRWSIKPWYTLSFGPIQNKISNEESPRSWVYHRLWRKALDHKVIIYPSFWVKIQKYIFKSKRAQDHEYVIGFIKKMLNPSVLWESFETLKPKDRGRLTKSLMRIKIWIFFEPIYQTLWTKVVRDWEILVALRKGCKHWHIPLFYK